MSALSRNDSDRMEQHLSPPGPHPQQQRGRDDSSSGDSAISMQSLNDSLPQHADLKHAANPHAAAAAATAASSSVNSSNNSTNATAQQEYLEDAEAELRATAGGDHQYEDALRRYSAEVAVHTAQMFETCYGSEGYASSTPSSSERAATPTITASSASRQMNRSSAAHPLAVDASNSSTQRKS